MKTDKYGIEIKVGDWVMFKSIEGMEYANQHAGSIQIVKKLKTKFVIVNEVPLIKAYPENLSRVKVVGVKKNGYPEYHLVATSRQQLDFKIKILKERLSNTSDESMKKYIQSDIDWEWTKHNKREQKQEERI